MSLSAKTCEEESLNDSWVDIGPGSEIGSGEFQRRLTPISSLISSGKLEKLLWEAQRESNQSSRGGSIMSSDRESPKSPSTPKSPHSSLLEDHIPPEEMLPVGLIAQRRQGSTDWIWDWSSRPDLTPPKEWKLRHEKQLVKTNLSFRKSKVVKSGLFSTEMLSILIATNLLSIVLGTGIGLYVSKHLGAANFHWPKH